MRLNIHVAFGITLTLLVIVVMRDLWLHSSPPSAAVRLSTQAVQPGATVSSRDMTALMANVSRLLVALDEAYRSESAAQRDALEAMRSELSAVREWRSNVETQMKANRRDDMHRVMAMWHAVERLLDDSTTPTTTLEQLLQRRHRVLSNGDRAVVLGVVNYQFRGFALNWICHLERVGVSNYLLIAEDDDVAHFLRFKGVPVYYPRQHAIRDHYGRASHAAANAAPEFGHAGFAGVVAYKSLFLTDVLDAGYSALVSDVDIVTLRDPFVSLEAAGALGADLAIQTDSCHPSGNFEDLNSGFFYARPTVEGKAFARRVNELMLGGRTDYVRQQVALNRAAREFEPSQFAMLDKFCAEQCAQRGQAQPCLFDATALPAAERMTIRILDVAAFPSGRAYYHWRVHEERNVAPTIIHNNWIRGQQAKQTQFERIGQWLVDADLLEFDCNATNCFGCRAGAQ